jgi:NAD(P)-dependent dehydrogenase (short-subunit alcohol dehydrogenase family)
MAGRLTGKVAVITGGVSGIGASTVELFLAEGAQVIAADIQDEKGERLNARENPSLRYVRCDVTSEADIEATVAAAKDHFGRLDIMFNNAGHGGTPLTATDMTVDGWDSTFALLLRGPMLGIKHAAALMQQTGGGSIINTASMAGLTTGWGYAYSVAKAGVLHMTRYAATQLAPHNIRVNAICPGVIATPIFGASMGATRDVADQMAGLVADFGVRMQPLKRPGLPEDIAEAALYLASEASRFMTGSHMVIDGGFTLGDRTAWDPDAPSPMKEAFAPPA